MLDTPSQDHGGTGARYEWNLAVEFKRRTTKPLILSGGLNPENVAKAIETVQPYAVDVASGVEASPGRKDHAGCAIHPPMQNVLTQVPDATGHFGPYGGMFVPETLMAPLHELTAEYEEPKRPGVSSELKFLLEEYAGRPTPLYFAERLTRPRRCEDLAQARGPAPHRRAQDQQRARPDPAGAADGQEAGHRRDRRGPARRGHGHGRGAVRARMRGLHGRGRHGASGAERHRMRLLGAKSCRSRPGRRRSRKRSTRRCATG